MTRYKKSSRGYHIKDKIYLLLVGSRAQVWHETAYKTSGDLTKDDLVMNKIGRVVSSTKHKSASKEQRLKQHGYTATKGRFGFVKMRKTRKTRSYE